MVNVSTEAGPGNRYTRVKAILEAAAGGGASDYGGLGRFWDLPLDALVEAKVFGVRLIAPAERVVSRVIPLTSRRIIERT
jgi:hypothetical protein